MEREVGPQVAGPLFIHRPISSGFFDPASVARKRNFLWENTTFHQSEDTPLNTVGYPGVSSSWNPKSWSWDSVNFVAKPTRDEGCRLTEAEDLGEKDRGNRSHELIGVGKNVEVEEVDDLSLKLGGDMYAEADSRPNKRVCAGSPSSSYPMCQVDDCKSDLSNAKDYHRRHKVCEVHSKTTKVLVGNQLQRFCQQCSRFHPLQEFDDGKRSCRRRLAGHNRRRRKAQPEDVSSRAQENGSGGNLNLVNVLTLFAQIRGNNADNTSRSSLPDKDSLLQIFNKINSITAPHDSGGWGPLAGNAGPNVKPLTDSLAYDSKANAGHMAVSSNLVSILSSALEASSRGSKKSANCCNFPEHKDQQTSPMTNLNFHDRVVGSELHKDLEMPNASSGLETSKSLVSPEASEWPMRPSRPCVPLPLFVCSPESSPSKMRSNVWYFSSDGSNPIEERSPSSSPVVQTLFPLHSSKEMVQQEKIFNTGDNSSTEEAGDTNRNGPPVKLFKGVNLRAENGTLSNLTHMGQDLSSQVRQGGYTSSSGSDHSPSSSNESLDRTGRISFKLFDKHPSNFPHTLRREILDWLSNCPSEIESYIRPGCVVLTIYLSMPRLAWNKFHEGLHDRVNALLVSTNSEFWSSRFMLNTDKQLASHKDGKIRVSRSWRMRNAPELIYTIPLAIQSGKQTSITLIGKNLQVTGTRIHCTYMGGYTSMEVPEDSSSAIDEEFNCLNFSLPSGAPMLFGRCFVEVENGFKGNSFPVIIADSQICEELRSLEPELEQCTSIENVILDGQGRNGVLSSHRKSIIRFLNELGWLFQRRGNSHDAMEEADFSVGRLTQLLAFAVERDWISLVKMLLDILMERNLDREGTIQETMGMLSEIQLLHKAVKRRCLEMVTLLLHYRLSDGSNCPDGYLFGPDSAGPGGITPLHLAACTQGCEDVVDALTNDPKEAGLSAWSSAIDASGYSPHGYALLKNHHSYIKLVQKKILEKTNGQISITVAEASPMEESWILPESERQNPSLSNKKSSCTRCSLASMKTTARFYGRKGLLHRPYLHSILAIAAVCVCVCILCRGRPQLGTVEPFKWENISYGWL